MRASPKETTRSTRTPAHQIAIISYNPRCPTTSPQASLHPRQPGRFSRSGSSACNKAIRRRPLQELGKMESDDALLQEIGTRAASSLSAGIEVGGRRHWDSYQWASEYPEDQ